MAARKDYFVVLLTIFFLVSVSCLPEPGKKVLRFDTNQTYGKFSKTMNKGYSIAMKGKCSGYKGQIQIKWRLEVSECAERFSFLKDDAEDLMKGLWNLYANHSLNGDQTVGCDPVIHLKDMSDEVKELIIYSTPIPPAEDTESEEREENGEGEEASVTLKKTTPATTKTQPVATKLSTKTQALKTKISSTAAASTAIKKTPAPAITSNPSRKRRSKDSSRDASGPEEGGEGTATDNEENTASEDEENKEALTTKKETEVPDRVCVTKHDGVFVLIVNAYPVDKGGKQAKASKDYKLTLNVEMKGKHGYLSASDWPLYPFYGFMSLLYVFYGAVWLVVSACQWRDLLRIQFWIGGVIALGMLEKAVFFSEYNNINITGDTNPRLTIFAELVSCVKRTLARILVIIVSMGFGIVKPRLGTTLHRVLGVGALYFILATIEGCFRALHPKSDPGRQQLIASIPLAVLDASICWWIFMSLVQTTRTLRIRRNLVKLSLYRHFTNTLIFAVLASVAYMIWSIKTHRFAKDGCITDWSELWLDEAFWHFLFSIVLLVIMVLWRPTANNQRYAFTPIVDFGDDDEDDDNMTLSDAFDGMKMRNVKNVPDVYINGDSKRKPKPEDDLKWVEENIPSSAADAVLPSVLDSDEELMTTKFEMSKME